VKGIGPWAELAGGRAGENKLHKTVVRYWRVTMEKKHYKWTIKEIFQKKDFKKPSALWYTVDYLKYLVPIYWIKRLGNQKN
jgi:hypothetical protein